MKYTTLIFCALLTVTFVLSTACNNKAKTTETTPTTKNRTKGQRGERPTSDQMMTKMDTNKDGRLSKTEARGPLQQQFSQIDTNGDGFIDKDELAKAPKPNRQGPPRGRN